uniref:ATP synthase F0 subunit 8 n=1 Tax=Gloeosoma sp. GLO01 TaxID=1205626 RepID=A0A0S2MS08_9CUCU|nr:ATP synthase F0 subunit 8 [Gloeosoma sp. GLO01]
MPQMAPLNWLILFIYFIFLMILINNFIYYLMNLKIFIKKKNMILQKQIWKW